MQLTETQLLDYAKVRLSELEAESRELAALGESIQAAILESARLQYQPTPEPEAAKQPEPTPEPSLTAEEVGQLMLTQGLETTLNQMFERSQPTEQPKALGVDLEAERIAKLMHEKGIDGALADMGWV